MNSERRPPRLLLLVAWLWCVVLFGCAPFRSNDNGTPNVAPPRHLAMAQRRTREGVAAVRAGDLERAAVAFDEAIRSDPTFGRAHNNRGLVHLHRDEIDLAIAEFDRAMEFLPGDPRVMYNLALAFESAGKRRDAADLYRRAVDSEPTNPVYLASLVRVRVRLGDQDPALRDQLEELLVIETRPKWRSWAEEQLAWSHPPGNVNVGGETGVGRETGLGREGGEPVLANDRGDAESYAGVQVIDLSPGRETLQPVTPDLVPDLIPGRHVVPALAMSSGPGVLDPETTPGMVSPASGRLDSGDRDDLEGHGTATNGTMIPAVNPDGGNAIPQLPSRFRIPETIERLHPELTAR